MIDVNQNLVFTVEGMKMWWIVVIREHLDDNAEKSCDFRQEPSPASGWETVLPVAVR